MSNTLRVIIAGGDQQSRTAISGLTTEVLSKHGFENVVNRVPDGEGTANGDRARTILDEVKSTNPGLFTQEVIIDQITEDAGAVEAQGEMAPEA